MGSGLQSGDLLQSPRCVLKVRTYFCFIPWRR